MATVKSLEDMLSSEFDESVVNALVGSLESQLASSSIHPASQDGNSVPVSVNHVNNSAVVDGNIMGMLDGQKHGVNAIIAASNLSKSQSLTSQIMDLNSATTTNSSNSVMVTLPGALPASGYITQVTCPPQHSFFTQTVAGNVSSSRPLGMNNQDIKIVYSTPSSVSHQNVTTASSNSVYSQRNMKITSVPNGNPNSLGMISIRPNQPLITVAAVNPIIAGSTTSMSTIHDLANIASQQTPIVIPNVCQPAVTSTTSHQSSPIQVNPGNGKSIITARMPIRDQVDSKLNDKNIKLTVTHSQDLMSSASSCIPTSSTSQVNSNIIQVNNPTVVASKSQMNQSVNVVSQVVSNSNIIPGVQIVNVNPSRLGTPAVAGQKTLAPRVVLSSPLRIAAAPQILTTRPGVQVTGQNTITLPPGVVRSAILVKTDNGQFQVVNVAQGIQSSSSGNQFSGAPTYRLQSLQPGTQVVRTLSPQQMTVTVPGSVNANSGKSSQQITVTSPQTIVGTVLSQGASLNAANSRIANASHHSISATQTAQTVGVKVSGVNGNLSTPLTVQTTSANNQTAAAQSQMSPNTAKRKCKNFLATLIRLADEQPLHVAKGVRNLIQGIIDGTMQAEEFTAKLQKELNSAPQPYLVPFLKKNLPFLRHSLITKELTIEGVRPPPASAVILPHPLQQIQVGNKRTVSQPATAQLRLMSPASGGTLTAQLLQPSQNILAQRFPRLPAGLMNQAKSLLVAAPGNKSPTVQSAATLSPATVGILQAKTPTLLKSTPNANVKDVAKRSFSSLRDDDDINDVAAMGGVNLIEESQRILASNADIVGTQIRSCKDETFVSIGPLHRRISALVAKMGLEETGPDVVNLIAHAAQERLKTVVEKLGIIAEHRMENAKNDSRYEVSQDVKYQLKFLEELDRLEKRRHEEQEREILLRAAKSRSKLEDPEQLKLKQKAKEMQRAEMEEMRQREANVTALLAIGPRKKLKMDSNLTTLGSTEFAGSSSASTTKAMPRPRVKRVNFRDVMFLMEQDRDLLRPPMLYKAYMK